MIKATIQDNRDIGCGLTVECKGKYCFICFDATGGFYINTYGRVVNENQFKEYVDEIKAIVKEAKRLNKKYGY